MYSVGLCLNRERCLIRFASCLRDARPRQRALIIHEKFLALNRQVCVDVNTRSIRPLHFPFTFAVKASVVLE